MVFALCLVATIFSWIGFTRNIDEKIRAEVMLEADEVSYKIVECLNDHEQILRSGVGLFNISDSVSRNQWRIFVASLQLEQHHPGILGVGYSIWLRPEDVSANIKKIRDEGFPEYVIRPPGTRPFYTSIIYLEPFNWRNSRAFGYDMYSEPIRRDAMDRAVNEGVPTMASNITLVQETEKDKQAGLLMYLPVYRTGKPRDTPEQRRTALKGFVYSPIRVKDFVYGSLGKFPTNIGFEIYDGKMPRPDKKMFSSYASENVALPDSFRPLVSITKGIQVFGSNWIIVCKSLPAVEDKYSRANAYLILLAGLLISTLLTVIALFLVKNRDRALKMALIMTKELRDSEEKVRLILDTSCEGIVCLDLEGCCTLCNPAGVRMLGYHTQEELLGKNMHQLVHHSHEDGSSFPQEDCPCLRVLTDSVSYHSDSEVYWRYDGTCFPVEYWAEPHYRDRRVIGAVVTFMDITERRDNQKALLELNRGLESRVANEVAKNREKDRALMLSEKMATLGQLAAGVAHEINNPMGYIACNLNTLINYYEKIRKFDDIRQENCSCACSEMVAKNIFDSRNKLDIEYLLTEGIDLINESLEGVERVTKIVQELKGFSRMDKDELQPMALNGCLDRALTIAHNELKYVARVRNEFATVPDILCHPGQLNQVFVNLLVNAGQAIIESGEIVVKCWHDEKYVYASVSDTGCGMPEEVRARIFEPFYTTKEEGKGTGLGLSISYEIIKNHRGEITVESEVGKGTTFMVRLPLAV